LPRIVTFKPLPRPPFLPGEHRVTWSTRGLHYFTMMISKPDFNILLTAWFLL